MSTRNRNEYMKMYMRARRAANPGLEAAYREKALKRKLGVLLAEMPISELETIIRQKQNEAAQKARREP